SDLKQEKHVRRRLQDPPWVRRLARYARRKAQRLGIVLRQSLEGDLQRPLLDGQGFPRLQGIVDVVDEFPVRRPDTGKVHLAVGRAWSGRGSRGALWRLQRLALRHR